MNKQTHSDFYGFNLNESIADADEAKLQTADSNELGVQRYNTAILPSKPKLSKLTDNGSIAQDSHIDSSMLVEDYESYPDDFSYEDNYESLPIDNILDKALYNIKSCSAQSKRHISHKTSCLSLGSQKKNLKWTKDEDELLENLVEQFKGRSWKKVSAFIPGRSAIQCLHRWTKILKPGLVKGPWTPEEDKILINYVKQYGAQDFSDCSKIIHGRNNKQCRERWFNVLNPQVIKGEWSLEEDYLIFRLYTAFGGKWIKFIPFFNGLRAENSIKNRFYSTIRRFNTVLRKNKKDFGDEQIKIDRIFLDFKNQISDKYNLKSQEDFANFEKTQLSFDGILDESKKDTREVFMSSGNKEKLGGISTQNLPLTVTNTTIIGNDHSFRDQFFQSQDKFNISKNSLRPGKNKGTEAQSFHFNEQRGTNSCFRKRKSTFSEFGIRESTGNTDNQSQVSKTPYLKSKKEDFTQSTSTMSSVKYNQIEKKAFKERKSSTHSQQCSKSLKDLEDNIVLLCDQPKFTFKDDHSKNIINKLQRLTEGEPMSDFQPFRYNYDQALSRDTGIDYMMNDKSNDDFSFLIRQISELEGILASTKKVFSERQSVSMQRTKNSTQEIQKPISSIMSYANDYNEYDDLIPNYSVNINKTFFGTQYVEELW